MTQTSSLLDRFLRLYGDLSHTWLPGMPPHLLILLVGMWLAVVGWKRHRAPGFLLLLAASVIGLAANSTFIVFYGDGSEFTPERARLASISFQIGIIAEIFGAAGIWHFAYRARFAPPLPQ